MAEIIYVVDTPLGGSLLIKANNADEAVEKAKKYLVNKYPFFSGERIIDTGYWNEPLEFDENGIYGDLWSSV